MRTVKHYRVEIPMSDKPAKEDLSEYRVLKVNKHNRMVIDDIVFTTINLKKEKYSQSNMVLNIPSIYKWNYTKPDVWVASCYYQCSDKIMRRKILNMLKKKMETEYYWTGEALAKLERLLLKK